jgi:hypothetical protein
MKADLAVRLHGSVSKVHLLLKGLKPVPFIPLSFGTAEAVLFQSRSTETLS